MSACFDEGILQAYADGELDAARAREVSAHVETCAACASAADEAADQFALLSSALRADDAPAAPTERLRARLDAAIAQLQATAPAQSDTFASRATASPSFVGRLRAFASSLVAAPRQATAFASLLVAAVLLGVIFYAFRSQSRTPQRSSNGSVEVAKLNPPAAAGESSAAEGSAGAGGKDSSSTDVKDVNSPAPSHRDRMPSRPNTFTNVIYKPEEGRRNTTSRPTDNKGADALLPVEKPYASAVASLKSSIDEQAARAMTPTLRAEYERNLAVVDRAIAASRAAARRDPSDEGAQEFLRAAYEDKIELLRAVSDQTQIAAIGRR